MNGFGLGLGLSFVNCRNYNNGESALTILSPIENFSAFVPVERPISLSWDAYMGADGGLDAWFEIRYWETSSPNNITNISYVAILEKNYDVINLLSSTQYTFQIRALRQDWDNDKNDFTYTYTPWSEVTKTTSI